MKSISQRDFNTLWTFVCKEVACFRVILENEDISEVDVLETLSKRMKIISKKIDESL